MRRRSGVWWLYLMCEFQCWNPCWKACRASHTPNNSVATVNTGVRGACRGLWGTNNSNKRRSDLYFLQRHELKWQSDPIATVQTSQHKDCQANGMFYNRKRTNSVKLFMHDSQMKRFSRISMLLFSRNWDWTETGSSSSNNYKNSPLKRYCIYSIRSV